MPNNHGSLLSQDSPLAGKERAGTLSEPTTRDPSHPFRQSWSFQSWTLPPSFSLHQENGPDSRFQVPLSEPGQLSLSSSNHYPLPTFLLLASQHDNTSVPRDGVPYLRGASRVSDERLGLYNSRTPSFSHSNTGSWPTIPEHHVPPVHSPRPQSPPSLFYPPFEVEGTISRSAYFPVTQPPSTQPPGATVDVYSKSERQFGGASISTYPSSDTGRMHDEMKPTSIPFYSPVSLFPVPSSTPPPVLQYGGSDNHSRPNSSQPYRLDLYARSTSAQRPKLPKRTTSRRHGRPDSGQQISLHPSTRRPAEQPLKGRPWVQSQTGGPDLSPMKRLKPPEPYSSVAILLADIIRNHHRRKMTLHELYDHLQTCYPQHFADDNVGENEIHPQGGWRVFPKYLIYLM